MAEKTTHTRSSPRSPGIYAAKSLALLASLAFFACASQAACSACASSSPTDDLELPDPRPIVEVHGVSTQSRTVQLTPTFSMEMPPEMRFIGTGWFISTDRRGSIVATAAHVCAGEASFKVVDSRGADYPATRIYSDEAGDVCLLHVLAPNRRTFRVTGWDSMEIPFGLPIWYVGFPQGYRVAFDGRISGVKDDGDGLGDRIILSLDVNPGASGSPVIFDGRVVSMAVMYRRDFHSLSFGATPEDLKRAQTRADELLWVSRRANTDPPEI